MTTHDEGEQNLASVILTRQFEGLLKLYPTGARGFELLISGRNLVERFIRGRPGVSPNECKRHIEAVDAILGITRETKADST